MPDLPKIHSIEDLARLTRLSKALLYRLSVYSDRHYRIFTVPKKHGGSRVIACPSKSMKAVQAWILRSILDNVEPSPYAFGFRRGSGTFANASRHVGRRYILNLDIEDFFPSIGRNRVYDAFQRLGYDRFASVVLTRLCTCRGFLPQGGVTSPALSNIVCHRLDSRLGGYAGRLSVVYTRYADDLTFSAAGHHWLVGIARFAEMALSQEGFTLNRAKTRFAGPRCQRRITGLVMGRDSLGVGRRVKRVLRAKLHKLAHSTLSPSERLDLELHMRGWLAYLKAVDPVGYQQLCSHATRLNVLNPATGHMAAGPSASP